MNFKLNVMTSQKRFIYIIFGALSLLLIPLIAMQFTSEVDWSPFDFVVMGVLLIFIGSLIELVLRKVKKYNSRIAWLALIFVLFLLIWAELAVGIFGTPLAGN